MKKLSILFLSIVALATTFTSCSKDEDPAPTPTTSLELTVQNYDTSAHALLEDATVDLYETQDDYYSQENKVTSAKTDSNGKVIFNGLKNIQYYFSVTKDCVNNRITSITNGSALVSGKNTFTVPVFSTALVKFTNTSTTNDWDVAIVGNTNDITLYTIPANASGYLTMPIGQYTIRMVEYPKGGDTPTGTTRDFDVILSCGQNYDGIVVP